MTINSKIKLQFIQILLHYVLFSASVTRQNENFHHSEYDTNENEYRKTR